jgi:hypothetical protein
MVAVAFGVAAATAAAALGLGYGLGIIVWTSATGAAGENAWLSSLAWTTWIAATSTVIGALVADRLSPGEIGAAPPRRSTLDGEAAGRTRVSPVATGAWRLVITITAAIGALLTVPLVAVPARTVQRPETATPQLIAGEFAVVGVVIGAVIAILALSARAVAANVAATAGWVWALAIAAVATGVAAGDDTPTAQLAVWHFGGGQGGNTFSFGAATMMLGVALVLGILAAWPALRRGDNRVGIALSGGAGPILVAAAYNPGAPRLAGVPMAEQFSAFLIAPYAFIAGLAGSVLIWAVITHRRQQATSAASPTSPVGASVPAQLALGSTVDDLEQDAYAPARAYGSGGTTDSDPPSDKVPLWPEPSLTGQGTDDMTTETKPTRGKSRRP